MYWHSFKIVNKLGVTKDDAEWRKMSLREACNPLQKNGIITQNVTIQIKVCEILKRYIARYT
jgi:hypothetical protein